MSLDAEDSAVETAMHRGRDWKGYAAMLGAVTALLTAWFHRQPEDAAKAGYIELTEGILDCQHASIKNHEDIVALSESLQSYIRGHTVIETTVAPAATGAAPVDAGAPSEQWLSAPTVSQGSSGKPKIVSVVAPPSSAAPVPSIAPLTLPKAPKSVDKISW
jgi:hypothetical protein